MNIKKEVLMQSKYLVNMSYEATSVQNRIFYNCLFNAQKEKNGELSCHITLDSLKKLISNKNHKNLKKINEIFNELKNTSLLFERVDDNNIIECDFNLIAGKEYNTETEEFKIYFLQRLYDHIIEYTNYAPLNLDILSKFQSFYTQRLYELLRLWSRTNKEITCQFSIDHLRFVLGAQNKYPDYKNFKQKVLSHAVNELNKIGKMKVSFSEIKKGRKVSKIEFQVLDFEDKIYFKNRLDNIDKEKKEIEKKIDINEILKSVCIPDTHIFKDKFYNVFAEYCYDNNIMFQNNKQYIELLDDTNKTFIAAKSVEVIKNIPNYKYFLGIFKNKLDVICENDLKEIKKNCTL